MIGSKQRPYNDPDYRAARALLTRDRGFVQCWHQCGRLATTIDHVPAILEHQHQRGTQCCQLKPACETCNKSHGATIGNRNRHNTSRWA